MLKNRTMKERSIKIAEEMKKSVQMNDDDLRQLSTSLENFFFQHLSS
jgi:hypothetical protein